MRVLPLRVAKPTLCVAIIGVGRIGQGLALALARSNARVVLVGRGRRPLTPPLVLHHGPRRTAVECADLVVIATPDEAIAAVALELHAEGGIGPPHVVLHVSGLLDDAALHPLRPTGAALGSFHPLQTIAEPATAPERFIGAYAGVQGDDRAVAAAEALARRLGMTPVRLSAAAKPAYHAGAVMVANYAVTLAATAERLGVAAGIAPDIASRLYLPLLRGVVANLESEAGAAAALTGPVRRGDIGTIRAHLAALPREQRELYRVLGLATLKLARELGLKPELANAMEAVLAGGA